MTAFQKIAEGGVTSAIGYTAAAAASGVKNSGKLDVALVVSERDCQAAAVFTRNQVAAAPVLVGRQTLHANPNQIRAIVANAGNANACTGQQGLRNARLMQKMAADQLGFSPQQVLVLSTGVIGVQLPMEKIEQGINQAASALSKTQGAAAARAIMTTDTGSKEAAVKVELSQGTISIGGMAKGSGMIHPDMATMLGVITTDATISAERLRFLLREAVDVSFNCISVDGDTSTNDTVLLLANSASGVAVEGAQDVERFATALSEVCTRLAHLIVRDGEGASKFVEIQVNQAPSRAAAHAVAATIATSPLVKTAFVGSDANWGRILAAAGRAGVRFDPAMIGLWIGTARSDEVQLVCDGAPTSYAEADAARVFAQAEFKIRLDLGCGDGSATMWTTDLTHEYVSINGDYRS